MSRNALHHHGMVMECSKVLHLTSSIDECLTANKILTIGTLALLSTGYASLETLTVFFETGRLFTLASSYMSCFRHLLLECMGILRLGISNGLVTDGFEAGCVLTIATLAPT